MPPPGSSDGPPPAAAAVEKVLPEDWAAAVAGTDEKVEGSGAVARAVEVLNRGGLVAFPTETVYGLGALLSRPRALARIFHVKGRPGDKPLIVHVYDEGAARKVVSAWPPAARRLVRRFWPGPLTLVLPRAPGIPEEVTRGGATVAVRCPSHPVARALLAAAEGPVAAPSANLSGRPSPVSAAQVLADLGGSIDMILDGGPPPGGTESTVVDMSKAPPVILRIGAVPAAEVEAALDGPR